MCAIIGAVIRPLDREYQARRVNAILQYIWVHSHQRGRDGRGYLFNSVDEAQSKEFRQTGTTNDYTDSAPTVTVRNVASILIANLRAEPTTEFVRDKNVNDQQPYTSGDWSIVHNGTIANDKELRTGVVPTKIDSAAIAEVLTDEFPDFDGFLSGVRKLKGSYAILATHYNRPDLMFVAANYRPVWYIQTEFGVFFASARDYFPEEYVPQMLDPYTTATFNSSGQVEFERMYADSRLDKALVVCSGGLDSVVSAAYVKNVLGVETELIHFMYGSRAEGREVAAVRAVAKEMGVPLTLFPLNVYSKKDSPLLDPDSKVAGGEEGAEFAHEWVPARNLLLLSVATAYAEANGFTCIVLGNNLEEAGAYPDNEPEFIAKFNDLLPFAVGDGKELRVLMPVGNLMKHEIVELGTRIGAPLHLTWSCYRQGELHCGTCGPCYMRRTAFEINNIPEVIQYKGE